jgi:hypothetical protein
VLVPHDSQIVYDRQFGAVARPLYAQLVAGGRIPDGAIMTCPTSSSYAPYYHYDLTFVRANITTGVATSDATGCQVLDLVSPDGSVAEFSWYAPNGVSFWEALHQLVGAPEPI